MNRSESIAALVSAIAKAQAVAKPAILNKENPHFRNRYADLASIFDAVREPFASQGIAVVQGVTVEETLVSVETMLAHGPSGEWMSSTLSLTSAGVDAQKVASAVTYGRRYSLAAMCGVVADEDDDGNAASEGHPAPAPRPAAHRPAARPSAAPADDVDLKFGKGKGKRLSEVSDDDIAWYMSCWQKDLEDPAKSKFHATSQRNIDTATAILAARSKEDAAPAAPPAPPQRPQNPPHVSVAWEKCKKMFPTKEAAQDAWKRALSDVIGSSPSYTMTEEQALDVESICSAIAGNGSATSQADIPF